MKKWALLGVAIVLATAVLGWAAREEEVVATSGAQIKVIKAEKGYVLEVSWSGGQEEDIAILGVMSPKDFGARAWPADPTQEGEKLVWHAGAEGAVRIPVLSTELDERRSALDKLNAGWTAGLTFVASKIAIRIHAKTDKLPTRAEPFASKGVWTRDVEIPLSAIGPLPSVLKPAFATRPIESSFPDLPVLSYEYDSKTEVRGVINGPEPVAWKGADRYFYPRPTLIQVSW